MPRATRADGVRIAGVAPSTVSLIVNARGPEVKVAPATIERVQEAARHLNYIPNAATSSLKEERSRAIALSMAQLPQDPFVPAVYTVPTTAIIEADKCDYLLIPIFQTGAEDEDTDFIRAVISDIQLAGVICETTSGPRSVGSILNNYCCRITKRNSDP
ncbi:LacI family DNA-binding transcriptional regulator [Schaalia sp. lx-100]|uniref:LacI family DNA-binding transcriptional regulator n=1 Tax=Schaalia sp. lx-100 TaxID=2899081 RepID=UPI001E47DDAF|nr:LacI family DNA-binding transcriptional regulator [Schaalia sp. lx-100]MCD4557359.1 LacI family DNA-binding transcriptional regulator [Schaalia sp. lx-100]